MFTFDARLAELKHHFSEISPAEANRRIHTGSCHLVDVRERSELTSGIIAGSVHLPKSVIELKVEQALPDKTADILLICGSGVRSLLAAESLMKLGYQNLTSVSGGMQQWKDQGLPTITPRMLSNKDEQRYGRHLLIPEVGEKGQLKLLETRVLLVGAGGLGSPAALYLAAAGIGTLGIIDNDVVELSNLQRQIVHGESSLGMNKVDSARARLAEINSDIRITTYNESLTENNINELFSNYDIVVDGCDNFQTRYLINDACVKHRIPNVHGAVYRFDGYVTVFDSRQAGPCYRCLYPEPPPPELAPSCMEAGVLGVLPGIIGVLQAVETIKVALSLGEPLTHRILRYDALAAEFTELDTRRNSECSVCGDAVKDIQYQHYSQQCSV